MDIAAPAQASATDDQELAKVLESMNNTLTTTPMSPIAAPDEPADTDLAGTGLQFEGAPLPPALSQIPAAPVLNTSPLSPVAPVAPPAPAPVLDPATLPGIAPAPVAAPPVISSPVDGDLETIKKDALTELRPLVDKLNLGPEDKFDTLLLIIRSTDDRTLVSQAHAAAKAIADDTRRAEALLDVIKEIDYFSHPSN